MPVQWKHVLKTAVNLHRSSEIKFPIQSRFFFVVMTTAPCVCLLSRLTGKQIKTCCERCWLSVGPATQVADPTSYTAHCDWRPYYVKPNSSSCSLEKEAVAVFWFCATDLRHAAHRILNTLIFLTLVRRILPTFTDLRLIYERCAVLELSHLPISHCGLDHGDTISIVWQMKRCINPRGLSKPKYLQIDRPLRLHELYRHVHNVNHF